MDNSERSNRSRIFACSGRHVTIVPAGRHQAMKTSHATGRARLAIPEELVALASPSADVAVLVDLDYLSHAGPRGFRVDDGTLASLLRIVEASAGSCGTLRYVRAACSTETAAAHCLVLAVAANNTWRAVTGRHGADACIAAELEHLTRTRRMRLVVLVAGDHGYARPVSALRAAGIAVWLIHRPGSVSWRLYRAASSATPLPPGGAPAPP